MSKQRGESPRRRRGAVITLLVGVVLTLLLPPLGVLGAVVSGIGGAIGSAGGPVFVGPNPNLVEVREGREVRLIVPADTHAPHLTACEVTAPSGAEVGLQELPLVEATEYRHGDDIYFAFARFQALESGEYVVDCSDAQAVVAATVHGTTPWLLPLILLGGGVIGGIVGVTLLIVGIVRLVRVNRHNRELKASDSPGVQNPVAADTDGAAEEHDRT